MIRKILEIKNLGLFDNYKWNVSLQDFRRFNIIYGWNGSGKTTLSRLFSCFELGKSEKHPNVKYEIDTTEGKYSDGTNFPQRIKVFNQDYISDNIDMSTCRANPIFILGEENKKLAESIRRDEKILRGDPEKNDDAGKLRILASKENEKKQKEEKKGQYFSEAAKQISLSLSGIAARNYRKNDAERDFELLSSKISLQENEIEECFATIKQQDLKPISLFKITDIEEECKKISLDVKDILNRTVENILISRLQEKPHISRWVEEGYRLHLEENFNSCEFCGQLIPNTRIKELAGFFNDSDKELKDGVDKLLLRIKSVERKISAIQTVDKANLFSEFQNEYLSDVINYEKERQNFLENISDLLVIIENKKYHTTESVLFENNLDFHGINESIKKINGIFKKHNEKSNNFYKAKEEAQLKIKNCILSGIYDEVEQLSIDIEKLENEICLLLDGNPNDENDLGINQLKARIENNRNKISIPGLACDEINLYLRGFLGRNELTFENSNEGYVIKRGESIAKNLSEGEKTAIAFVYFIIHLKDRDFDLKKDIVVVDDPISSLDSNSLFQAFSFLKNSINDCAQVFILTHNYDFLHLLLNWLTHGHNNESNYYMIKNHIKNEVRIAEIDNLDKLLKNYSSEYQYLFKVLYDFKPDGTIDSVYNLPNIARKVLDNFLLIMVPDNSTPFKKLEMIDYDTNKKTAIYKFTNDQSHIKGKGFDPSLVVEAENVITYLLEMMKSVFPSHYEILENSIKDINP
jgi:wobble nucleotide-excising tRNase